MPDNEPHKIPYEFAQEFADKWADINALYHVLAKMELKIFGLIKWQRHTLSDQEYEVMKLRYAPKEKGGRLTLEEIGQATGMTKQGVQQVEVKALKKLGVKLYQTTVVYTRGGEGDGTGKHSALSSRKFKALPED